MNFRYLISACVVQSLFVAGPAIAQPAPKADVAKVPRFHDPSTPIKQGDTWYVFSTGTGIQIRISKDLKTWTDIGTVFKDKEFPAWHKEVVPTQKGHLWAPDIIHHKGRYLLYYSVSSWGSSTSAIGLVSSPTLDPKDPAYHWRDEGIVIQSKREDGYNAIDPQLFADSDGKLWMVFGSFWKGIQLIELDAETGLRDRKNQEVRQLAWNETIEAAGLLKHDDYYYLFVNWGLCCKGIESTYEIRIGRSKKVTGPYLDAEGNDLATGGGTLFLKSEGTKIGPGHPSFVTENKATRMFYHYYDAQRRGTPTLGDLTLQWTADGWPKP